ncbi:choice-of-anchor J domain-containing protein [Winogradskyella sediminis]|uniref:Gliding motility-associated C-terminal domain-containing protein n=1 Tax=Winogradskyella sediminis TaxID=1382466 RepID=A0A1H1ML05_9FLAO|nr:choice-of-anchor J domain-containing protein [Winogradskyella sediminis]SDR87426.1 gliding motility-associated C-terminal domain-containing protein [Winogradskyella sediminis]
MKTELQPEVMNHHFFSNHRKNENLSFKKTKSGWILTLIFIWLCSSISFAQLSENFDSGIPTNPSEWTLINNGVGTLNWSSTTDGYLGTNGAAINPAAENIGDQNTAEYFLVTPQIVVPENGEIQFYTKQGSEDDNGTQYEVRLSTAAQPDVNGFNIAIQSYTESNLNVGAQTSYEKKVIEIPTSIPAGLNIYIAFVAINTQNGATPTGDEWFIDDVAILEGCFEIEEDDVNVEDITVDGALVTWSHPTATNFEIQILPEGGVPADSGIPVAGTSYALANLDDDTEFDIYISAVCDNDTESAFTGPYTFKTLRYGLSCEAPIEIGDISTTPYVLTDNLDNWSNPDVTYSTQGTNCVPGSSTTNYLNGNKIFLSYTPTQSGLLSLTQETGTDGGANGNNCYNSRSSLFVYDSCADVGVSCTAGVITTSAFDPKTISNLLVQAGQTYIIVVSSELTASAGICFELEITAPTCAPPGNITYNSLTENSVNFSWDNIGGFSDSWEYSIVPTEAGEPTGSGTATSTNTSNQISSGLAPGTTYDFYVRSICSGSPGVWSAPITFTTQCTVFDTPYFTDFATATNENPEPCWTTIDANGDGTKWAFIGGYATLQTRVNNVNGLSNDYYVSPQINFDGVQKRIRYKHRATQGVSTYTIKLSTSGVGVEDFTTVILPETTINNTGFIENIVDIPEGVTGNVNIAFVIEPYDTETALRLSIDDVYIEDKPTCPDPLNPFVLESQITTNSAWLLWTAGDEETQWEVAIQDLGAGVPTTDGVLVDNNAPYIASGLDAGRRYEFYVRAYCSEDDQSQWVGPVPFTTLCESYDTPFFESFNDDDAETQKFCWEITDNNNDGSTWIMDDTDAYINAAIDYDDYLISPAINLDGTPKLLKYKYRSEFSFFSSFPRFGLQVLMSTTNTNPTSFTEIIPLEVYTNSNYVENSVVIEGTGTIYIAFRVPPEFSNPASILSIEDVSITDAPDCPNPTGLMVDGLLTTSAELSWTPGFQETNWNIVVQPQGSGVPSNSGTAVTSPSYIAEDLSADTAYEFYVMADCGDGTSQWVGPMSFRTLCNAFTSPFVETFNSDSESESCWTIINNNNDDESWELNTTGFTYEGDQAAVMFTGSNGQNDDYLISPTITITENQRLRYYYRVNDSFFTEDLDVLLSTNGTALDQFTTLLYDSDADPVIINNVEYKVKVVNFPAGISGDINIAFHVPFFQSTMPYRGQTLAIDNVNIEDVPECAEPTNIFIDNITDTQVQVNWEANGSESAWEISVQPTGTPTPIGDTDPAYLYNASTNPFTVTGLEASTMYDVYVRAVCDGDNDHWTGPVVVTTKCSFENLCQYTFLLTSETDVSATLDITQNNQVVQSLPFEGNDAESFTVFLCSGAEFSAYFDTIGSNQAQYSSYQFDVLDSEGVLVYSSPSGIALRTTVYTGTSICGTITCPQPTDLSIDDQSVFSWTAGGSETQWEVAIQSIENGTIPQSGTVVSTNSYTPVLSDFNDPNAASYEYFVRAICGTDDESFWSGPFEFVRNDDISNAIAIPINANEICDEAIVEASFIGATVSAETMSCDGTNGGDVWFEFTAESLIHTIEVNSYSGSFRDSNGDPLYPELTMTLYKDNGGGNLEEIICTYDNALVAMYASELIVGENYKLRLTLNSNNSTAYRFGICLKTPDDLCNVSTINGGFEEPNLAGLSGVNTIISMNTVPGWRSNLDSSNDIFYWESLNAPGFQPYEGGQCVQILSDQGVSIDPNDNINVKGYYRDFDTSEISLMDFSYAHLARFDDNSIELFAGPIGGPYTLINEHLGVTQAWTVVTGQYSVPTGQEITRFIFRSKDNAIGNVLDAVHIVANNEIVTTSFTVDCTDASATIMANGTGTWIADENNPGPVTIVDPNNSTTDVINFVQNGTYIFTWQSGYCFYDIEIIYNGVSETPLVESPVEYCLNDVAVPLVATPADALSLVWYTEATGGTGSATAPTPDASIANTTIYYVAYTDTEGCEGPRAEIEVVVSESFTPELTFTYDTTCVVSTVNPVPSLSTEFATGGTFTSTTLTVDATTGAVDMTSASVGQHDVIYTYDGDENTCTSLGSYTATIEFTAASVPVTGFDYGTTAYCVLSTSIITPTLDPSFTTGGMFSATSLTVDATTGAIDLATATAGSHEVTYTVEADEMNCSDTGFTTTTIEITASTTPITDFSYVEDVYCADTSSIFPELSAGFTIGGTFSAESGLAINPTTGEINVASSTLGNYNVTYEISEDISNCIENNTSTFNITILDAIEVGVEGECNDSDYILTASPLNGSFESNEADYIWKDANGTIVGENSETFNVSDYASQNTDVTVPLQFSVTVDFGGCSVTTSYTTERLSCRDIPRGISPDGNGKNDAFDLLGYGVKELNIFNRHGVEVYNFNGTYTNQWYGQTNNGDDLPDGTYFYTIHKEDGSSLTGWVFINRAQ